jgi:hypothetical protein
MKGSNLATALRLQRVSKSPFQFNLVTLKAKSLGLGPLRDPPPSGPYHQIPTPRPQLPKSLISHAIRLPRPRGQLCGTAALSAHHFLKNQS